MRGRLRSAPRSSTRPPQRWQRPTKTRDPNWHRAGSGSTRVRMEAGREATTTCWAWQAEPEGNTRIPIRCRGGQLADGRLRKERSKSQNLSKKGKTTKTRAAWASRWSATRRQEKPAKTGVFSLTRAGLLMEDAETRRKIEKAGPRSFASLLSDCEVCYELSFLLLSSPRLCGESPLSWLPSLSFSRPWPMKSERLLDLLEQPAKPAVYAPWKPLMVCPDAELASRLRAACAEVGINGVTHLSQYPRIGGLASALAERQANLCLIDVAAHAEFALLLIGEASAVAPVVA